MTFNTIYHPLSFHAKNIRKNQTMWFELQTVDILNHVPTFSHQEHSIYQTTCPHSTNHLQHHSTKGQHDTLYGSIGLTFKQPTSCDILPFRNYTATSYYPVFTDRHSLLYGMLTFLLHFMTNTFFSTFLPLSPPPSASTLFLNHTVSPIQCTPPSLNPLTKKSLVITPPSSPSHSPDLGCVGAQTIMLLGRFLVYPSHLLSVGPRLARM